MTDRELLEAAAKAAGHGIEFDDASGLIFMGNKFTGVLWNPLHNDGDALRLMVKLHMQIKVLAATAPAGWPWAVEVVPMWPVNTSFLPRRLTVTCTRVSFIPPDVPDDFIDEMAPDIGRDQNAATRRAIVRAAATMANVKTNRPHVLKRKECNGYV